MNVLTTHRAGWLLIGITVLPLIPASAGPQPPPSQAERLEWLLTTHDVRHAIQAPSVSASDCLKSESERGR